METISLEEVIRQWTDKPLPNRAETTALLDAARERELKLRKLLPAQIVRRLDAGFARSNTVHPDTAHALYSVCLLCGTQDVFETGTYWGYSTAYLAAALRDRNAGKVYTFDIYPKAGKHIPRSLMPHIEIHRGEPSTVAMPPVLEKVTPGLFFQDSRHDYEGVADELKIVVPRLPKGAVILFHDFVEPNVSRAAVDHLPGYNVYVLRTDDPQQLGIALPA